jgi:predicted nucleic-acid-binding protein
MDGQASAVKITADTNLLVRAITQDDAHQANLAQSELANADLVVLTLPTLCELSWVLARLYKRSPDQIASVVRTLIETGNVLVNRAAAEAGLALLDRGGDFADGVIAFDGRWQGADAFVSFDRQAVRLLEAIGEPARLLR